MPFNAFDRTNQLLLQIAGGDRDEAVLLARAIRRAALAPAGIRTGAFGLDAPALSTFTRTFFNDSGTGTRGGIFRDAQRIADRQLRLNASNLAFTGPPDVVREEHAAFCRLMYRAIQIRFLDRHPGETPEDFLNRPRKRQINITRVIINALSNLYAKRPVRTLVGATSGNVQRALVGDEEAGIKGLWSGLYDLQLLQVDRFTRLEGTIAVRPFFAPRWPGKVRLVVFHSDQLRVVMDESRPWQPLAVIERVKPFDARGHVMIWTDHSWLKRDSNGKITGGQHTIGRIPLVFFHDGLPSGSFFIEGRGRELCDANAAINGKLTDLEENYQYQSFAVPQVVNHHDLDGEEDIVLGPRRVLEFNGVQAGQPHGLEFKAPPSRLGDLRGEINADIESQFRINGVPMSALGAAIEQRALSGEAIRESMRPILRDFEQRGILFGPLDEELADVSLRVRAEHDPDFSYDPQVEAPLYAIDYQEPTLPAQLRDVIMKDEFDIAHGAKIVPDLMLRDNPGKWPDREKATEAWVENIEIQAKVPTSAFVEDDAVPPPPPEDVLEDDPVEPVEPPPVPPPTNGNGNGNGNADPMSIVAALGG